MNKLLAVFTVIAAIDVGGMSTVSASPQDDLWNLANSKHVSAGCAPYTGSTALMETAVEIAKVMTNPPGGLLGNGRVPANSMLADRGYYVTVWGEADYINSSSLGSPQAAMDFWMRNPTRDIFPNCGIKNMATAVWIQNNKWAAVVLAASPGGSPPQPPVIH